MSFEKGTKKRREKQIETLIIMRKAMLDSDNWEHLEPEIEAVTMAAMAIQRLNQIDFPDMDGEQE